MKRQTVYSFRTMLVGITATLTLPLLLAGCGGKTTEKPVSGYPGGQKAGPVKNVTNEPGYNPKGGTAGSGGH